MFRVQVVKVSDIVKNSTAEGDAPSWVGSGEIDSFQTAIFSSLEFIVKHHPGRHIHALLHVHVCMFCQHDFMGRHVVFSSNASSWKCVWLLLPGQNARPVPIYIHILWLIINQWGSWITNQCNCRATHLAPIRGIRRMNQSAVRCTVQSQKWPRFTHDLAIHRHVVMYICRLHRSTGSLVHIIYIYIYIFCK